VQFRLEWNFREAEAGLRRAVDLKPGFAKGYEWYGLLLALRARHDEALAMMRRAEELDPLSTSVSNGVGRVLYFSGRYDESVEQFRKTLTLDPLYPEAYFGLGRTYTQQKKYREAVDALREAVRLSGGRKVMRAALGYVYARQGNRAAAVEILESFRHPEDGSAPSPYLEAMVLLGLGSVGEAITQLERSYEQREGLLLYLGVDTFGLPADDPRYRALLRKIFAPE
jgi:tetratricopeptide (TPR) repeat protein